MEIALKMVRQIGRTKLDRSHNNRQLQVGTKMMKQLIVIGLALAILLPLSGIAQDKDEQQKKLQAIARLKPGRLVRLHAQNLGEVVGKYHSSNTDSLFISVDMVERGVPISAIDALWVRGRATGKGALIGGVVLGAFGTIVGIGLNSDDGFLGCEGDCPEIIPILGFAGAAGGGLVGAGVGTAFPKWHQRYRSPDYDPEVYSNLSEVEFADYWDGEVEYTDIDIKEVRSNRLRFSIVPDIRRGGMNVSAKFAF